MTNSKLGLWIVLILTIFNCYFAASINDKNALDSLYDNLLQREYTGDASFPEYMNVERKAQRSAPALRLRFGKRSDSDFSHFIKKRWLGDVNQKPIRSPSFRLRFGKRDSNPNNIVSSEDNFDASKPPTWFLSPDYEIDDDNDFERIARAPTMRLRYGRSGIKSFGDQFKRAHQLRLRYGRSSDSLEKRAPSMRLRWGRSDIENQSTEDILPKEDINDKISASNLLLSMGYSQESVNSIIKTLKKIEDYYDNQLDDDILDRFERMSRKPKQNNPLRLRWGRSINHPGDEIERALLPNYGKTFQPTDIKASSQIFLTSTNAPIQD